MMEAGADPASFILDSRETAAMKQSKKKYEEPEKRREKWRTNC
jgi:hypothetical protein